jgi:hypothetical protein
VSRQANDDDGAEQLPSVSSRARRETVSIPTLNTW